MEVAGRKRKGENMCYKTPLIRSVQNRYSHRENSKCFGFQGLRAEGNCSSDGKESACNAGDPGSIPALGRSSGEGNGNPLQYSCLENHMD